jgi:hypothetical protein
MDANEVIPDDGSSDRTVLPSNQSECSTPGVTCPKPWHGLFERLISEWDHRQSPDADCTETIFPSAVYTDPEQYQAELSRLFRGLPLCLGHEDQLDSSGTVLARDIAGLPLLMTRASGSTVRVFLNACRIAVLGS